MAELFIQFSRAAPLNWFDRWVLDRSKMICRITRAPFSHVDLELCDHPHYPHGALLGASNNPEAPVITGNARGVAVRPFDYQEFAIRRVARIPCSEEVKDAFINFCLDQLGKPFDSEALSMKLMFSTDWTDRDWRDDRRWFCAEMLTRAAEVSGLLTWQLACLKSRVSPSDLLLIINPLMPTIEDFWAPIPGVKLGRYEELPPRKRRLRTRS